MTDGWQEHAGRLADLLVAKGKVRSPEWESAVRAVPRHLLVPAYYQQDKYGQWTQHRSDTAEGMTTVYSNTALFTALDERQYGVSSTSQPGLMTRMLELLDIHDGHRVLEIGTGTGYNAALLSHRLGEESVFSVDIDHVADARARLAALGYHPTLVTTDGEAGLPEYAPYDRIISTVAVPHIPYTWVRQIRDDGVILTDLKLGSTAGNLVLLRRNENTAEGSFDTGYADFMSMRHPERPATVHAARADETGARRRSTTAPPLCWEHPVPWFLAQFELPHGVGCGMRFDPDTREPNASTLTAPDGSWATVTIADNGHHAVTEAGPTRLWEPFEHAYHQWHDELGQPDWGLFGLTVTPNQQTVWLNHPKSDHTWTVR